MIRAAFINHHTGFGGAEMMLLTLLERLDRARVAPVLMTPGEGVLTEGARDLGVEVRVVPVAPSLLGVTRGGAASPLGSAAALMHLPAAALRHARAIRAAGADVVVTNSAKAHVYGSLAGRLARRPVVWRMHDTMDSADFAGSTRRLLLAVGRRIPALILTVTDATGRVLVTGGVPPERVTTLYNGIDLAALRADAARAARRDGAPRVGSVGRITPLKGHAVVIEAAARLQERGVDARFVIAGAPSHEAPGHLEELRERAERLGVGERVELISPFPDLAEVLSGLDVMVSASVLPDSLPTTVIASMALGVPVVASELGGGPELVRDDETGIVVPPNDAGRIADAVAALIAAPERRAAYGRAASEDATARFDVDDFADAFAGHLEERRPGGVGAAGHGAGAPARTAARRPRNELRPNAYSGPLAGPLGRASGPWPGPPAAGGTAFGGAGRLGLGRRAIGRCGVVPIGRLSVGDARSSRFARPDLSRCGGQHWSNGRGGATGGGTSVVGTERERCAEPGRR